MNEYKNVFQLDKETAGGATNIVLATVCKEFGEVTAASLERSKRHTLNTKEKLDAAVQMAEHLQKEIEENKERYATLSITYGVDHEGRQYSAIKRNGNIMLVISAIMEAVYVTLNDMIDKHEPGEDIEPPLTLIEVIESITNIFVKDAKEALIMKERGQDYTKEDEIIDNIYKAFHGARNIKDMNDLMDNIRRDIARMRDNR